MITFSLSGSDQLKTNSCSGLYLNFLYRKGHFTTIFENSIRDSSSHENTVTFRKSQQCLPNDIFGNRLIQSVSLYDSRDINTNQITSASLCTTFHNSGCIGRLVGIFIDRKPNYPYTHGLTENRMWWAYKLLSTIHTHTHSWLTVSGVEGHCFKIGWLLCVIVWWDKGGAF